MARQGHGGGTQPHPGRQRLEQQLTPNLVQALQPMLEQLQLVVQDDETHGHDVVLFATLPLRAGRAAANCV